MRGVDTECTCLYMYTGHHKHSRYEEALLLCFMTSIMAVECRVSEHTAYVCMYTCTSNSILYYIYSTFAFGLLAYLMEFYIVYHTMEFGISVYSRTYRGTAIPVHTHSYTCLCIHPYTNTVTHTHTHTHTHISQISSECVPVSST